jgi:flagellar biosynthetic protein FliR
MFGLHIKLAQYFLMTYDMVPFGGVLSPNDVLDVGLAQISSAFSMSFALAAPFVIASLLYNVTLGVINRAMPQLMVSFVGAPAITAAGLILLMLSAPLILSYWLAAFDGFLLSPFECAR